MSSVIIALATATVTAVALVGLWLWQDSRAGRPAGPLARRLGPFLDLLDARYAPLLFVATPQAYTVTAWLAADGAPQWVAVLGGVGFEAVYVGAIAWAERGAGWQAARPPAITALLFSVGVAVAHYGATRGALAVLHIGFPLVGYAYTVMMHARTGPRPEALRAELDQAHAALAQAQAELGQITQKWAEQGSEAARAWDTADQLRAELDQAQAEAAHWRGMAAQAAARPALTADHDTVTIGGRSYSARAVAQALDIPKSTLARKLAQLEEA